MSVNAEAFSQFQQAILSLEQMSRPSDLSPEDQVARVKSVFERKLDESMAVQLESCIHCGQCAEACHFHVQTQDPKYIPVRKFELLRRFYRREKSPMRWIHRLYTRDITAGDLEEWQELVYDSCTECARCATVCPMGINIASMVNITRQGYAEAGLIPGGLQTVEQEQCEQGTVFGVGEEQFFGAIEWLKEEGLEAPLNKAKADILLVTTVVDIMLFKDALRSTVKILNHLGVDWTFSSHGFEAANFGLLSGLEDLQKHASGKVIDAAIACGAKTVIIPECGHAYPAIRWEGANERGEPLPFKVMAIAEYMGQEVSAGRLKLKKIGKDKKVTYHDPCKIARHGGVVEEPRQVLNALGVDFRDMESPGIMNWCCGGGAGVFLIDRAADLRNKAFEIKIKQVNDTGADSVVLTCGSCRANFLNGKEAAQWDKKIESLVELVGDNLA